MLLRHATLARASLARFADAPTPANLNFLFHSSYTILPADLRKSILTLAVQGKLVPQDPNDEPGETFFNKPQIVGKFSNMTHLLIELYLTYETNHQKSIDSYPLL